MTHHHGFLINPEHVGPLPPFLALPSREISHLLSNCTTRSWTRQTHYSLIITLKSLHRCALYPPQLILPSLYTSAPCDPCTDLSALCQASRRGEGCFGKAKRKKKKGGAGRREALLRSLWLHLMSPPFIASRRPSGSHTNTVMRDHTQRS